MEALLQFTDSLNKEDHHHGQDQQSKVMEELLHVFSLKLMLRLAMVSTQLALSRREWVLLVMEPNTIIH